MSLYFGNDTNVFPDEDIHADHPKIDYSLCGMGNIEDAIDTEKRITCEKCIEIIKYCKGFKSGKDYKPDP